MAEAYQSFGTADLAATTLTDIVTMANAGIVDVTFCNRTGADISIRLAHSPLGAAVADKHYCAYDVVLPGPGGVYVHPAPLKCAATDVIRAYASATGVSVSAEGVAIT